MTSLQGPHILLYCLQISNSATKMTKLLGLVISHSQPYNLHLNRDKCQLLVTNDLEKNVHFPDGTAASKHASIKYLGATFSSTLDVAFIVRQKLTEATTTMRTLSPLWTDSHISTAWKLVVFNAVIRSRVFYTLETLELTQGQQRLLDTLYFTEGGAPKNSAANSNVYRQNLDT